MKFGFSHCTLTVAFLVATFRYSGVLCMNGANHPSDQPVHAIPPQGQNDCVFRALLRNPRIRNTITAHLKGTNGSQLALINLMATSKRLFEAFSRVLFTLPKIILPRRKFFEMLAVKFEECHGLVSIDLFLEVFTIAMDPVWISKNVRLTTDWVPSKDDNAFKVALDNFFAALIILPDALTSKSQFCREDSALLKEALRVDTRSFVILTPKTLVMRHLKLLGNFVNFYKLQSGWEYYFRTFIASWSVGESTGDFSFVKVILANMLKNTIDAHLALKEFQSNNIRTARLSKSKAITKSSNRTRSEAAHNQFFMETKLGSFLLPLVTPPPCGIIEYLANMPKVYSENSHITHDVLFTVTFLPLWLIFEHFQIVEEFPGISGRDAIQGLTLKHLRPIDDALQRFIAEHEDSKRN